MNKIIAGYARVSTELQVEEGSSIGMQQEKIRQYCQLKDLGECKLYVDPGFSGGSLKRPAMQRLISDCENKKVEQVVVFKLDRLSRSQKDTMYLIEDVFQKNGIKFVSISENFDTTTPMGMAMIGLLSVFAQLERGQIFERTRSGLLAKVKQGYFPGGNIVPFGYKYDSDRQILIPYEKEAKIVQEVFSLYAEGYSTDSIYKILKLSSPSLVVNILHRKTYLGYIQYKGKEYKGKHEPIVSEKLFYKVQKCLQKRAKQPSTKKSDFLLAGLIKCGVCGEKMSYRRSNNYIYISCISREARLREMKKIERCDNIRFNGKQIEELVVSNLLELSVSVENISPEINLDSNIAKELKNNYDSAKNKLDNLYDLYADNPSDFLKAKIDEINQQLNFIQEQIDNENEKNTLKKNVEIDVENIKNLKDTWEILTFDEKKLIIKDIVDVILLWDDHIEIKLKI